MKTLNSVIIILGIVFCLQSCDSKKNNSQESNTNSDIATVNTDSTTLQSKAVAAFQFEEMKHDFGVIKQGEKVTHIFKFKNTGDVPLRITDIKTSCGCTASNWPKKEIPAGESDEIEVNFDSSGKTGQVNKTVTIFANTSPNETKLIIKGNIETEE